MQQIRTLHGTMWARLSRSFLPLIIVLGVTSARAAQPHDVIRSPIAVVSEDVHVSVGPKMALIVGRYWYQYIPQFDNRDQRLAIHYFAYVPKNVTTHADLLEASQIKMVIDEKEYRPESARVLDASEVGAIQAMPEDAAIGWFTFQIPRSTGTLRFGVLISHFQSHYTYENKTVAAYLPWLPHLEELRLPSELKDIDFKIMFEALPGASFNHFTTNLQVKEKSDTQLLLHPRHLENIAVSVLPKPAAANP